MGRDEVDQCESCLQEAYARERSRCEAEMQKLRRVIEWIAEMLADLSEATMGAQTAEEWIRTAEQAVAEEISPEG